MSKRIAEILKQSYVTRPIGFLDITAKEELFKEITAISGGTFTKSHTPGNVLSTLRIVVPYKKWEIILTESDTRPLKFQIGFESLNEYELIIGIEDVFDKILKRLGKQEIEVGDKGFDSQYLIHSNDPVLTGKLLNDNVRNKILKHNLYNISYLTDHKKKKSELISVVSRTIEDKEIYLDLISLHQMLIDNLSESGIINSIPD
ncbi:MAG: hypothetical protein WC699_05625 [Bacteroidales bacterium]|jgi:hypothetical protein